MNFQFLLHILTIVFITLKLCGVIAWNWFFVLLPSIWGLIAAFAIWLVYIILVSIAALGKKP